MSKLRPDRELIGATKPDSITQDAYEYDVGAKRVTLIPTNHQLRIAYDASSNPEYIGFAPRGLAEGTDGWLIQKLSWDVSGNCTGRTIGINGSGNYGNWTARASLTYA